MGKGRSRDPFELLVRRGDPGRLLELFQQMSERFAAACADSAKAVAAQPGDGPAVSARGNLRRLHLDRAFKSAASHAGFHVVTNFTTPASWNFPVVRLGAFSLTLGIVQRTRPGGPRRLRTRGTYAHDLAMRNQTVNPQGSLLEDRPGVVEVIPDGSLGAFVVIETSVHVPDSPIYVGLLVPSPDLRRTFYRVSLERLIGQLEERVGKARKPVRKSIERKKPKLRKKPKRPRGE